MKKNLIKEIAVCSVFGAIGFILMLIEFPLAFIIPSFIKMDFSELPALIASFTFGPIFGVLVCLIKNLLHLFVTSSFGVGELSNFILGAVFTFVSGTIYSKNKTRKGALSACIIGSMLMGIISVITNYFIIYPFYVSAYGMPMDVIIKMYSAILPFANTLPKALLIFNLPFTFVKGMIDSVLCFLIYKKISPILKLKTMEKL